MKTKTMLAGAAATMIAALVLAPSSAPAAVDPADACAAAKAQAVAKKLADKINCHAKALKKGVSVDPACLTKAEEKFDAAFAKAEGKGGCNVEGDAATFEGGVDSLLSTLLVALPARVCDEDGSSEACLGAMNSATCQASPGAGQCDSALAADCLNDTYNGECAYYVNVFGRAEACCPDGLGAATTPTGATKCALARQKAAAKKLRDKVKCYVKAFKKGVSVDATCLTKAEDKFDAAFTKAAAKGDCATAADAAGVEGEIDVFLDSAIVLLTFTPGSGTCPTDVFGSANLCMSLSTIFTTKPACLLCFGSPTPMLPACQGASSVACTNPPANIACAEEITASGCAEECCP